VSGRRLAPKLVFRFDDPDDFPELSVDVKIETTKRPKAKIIEHRQKKKAEDASTKLF